MSEQSGGGSSDFCPRFHHAIELIGKRWTGAVLRALLRGPRRFNELLSAIPDLSDRLLAERLRELESEEIVSRHVDPGPPVRVAYELTASGKELETALRCVGEWAERWVAPPKRKRTA
ncbi:MAG TPA: helix-turn-helix domain-containing protein [Candidatus Eremiobacteraceae bacterium]|nr:helix-turn-helix domain-containing protein [Candidatus Eremiobacteraceae bacterium]